MEFWNWFTANNERLTMLNDLAEAERVALLDDMQHQLDLYCQGLSFEMGDTTDNGRKLTFSAEGDIDLFSRVSDLVEDAPDLDWWEFVAFKQPQGTDLRVIFDRCHFETHKMFFQLLSCDDCPDQMGLRVAFDRKACCPPDTPDDDVMVGIYVTIEALVGEFACATLIGYLETCPLPKDPLHDGFRPLDDLPKFCQ